MVRQALVALLGLEPDIEVVAQAAAGDEAVAMSASTSRTWPCWTSRCPAARHRGRPAAAPDGFPGQVVIVTTFGRPGYLRRAMDRRGQRLPAQGRARGRAGRGDPAGAAGRAGRGPGPGRGRAGRGRQPADRARDATCWPPRPAHDAISRDRRPAAPVARAPCAITCRPPCRSSARATGPRRCRSPSARAGCSGPGQPRPERCAPRVAGPGRITARSGRVAARLGRPPGPGRGPPGSGPRPPSPRISVKPGIGARTRRPARHSRHPGERHRAAGRGQHRAPQVAAEVGGGQRGGAQQDGRRGVHRPLGRVEQQQQRTGQDAARDQRADRHDDPRAVPVVRQADQHDLRAAGDGDERAAERPAALPATPGAAQRPGAGQQDRAGLGPSVGSHPVSRPDRGDRVPDRRAGISRPCPLSCPNP